MAIPESVYVHPTALVESDDIGERTRIWAFVHILPDVHIGADCNVADYVSLEAGVYVGDRVTLKGRAGIGAGVHIEDDVFVAPNVYMVNDTSPRSPRMADAPEVTERYTDTDNWMKGVRICRGATIGTSAVIGPGVTVGEYATVGATSLVIADVAPHQFVLGSPARRRGWVCKCGHRLERGEADDWRCPSCSKLYRLSEADGLQLV